MPTNLYDLLQILPTATTPVIEAAYSALSGSETRSDVADRLKEARDTLVDPARRAAYDGQGSLGPTVGGYRLVRRIAEGGFGKTYLAEHILTGEQVCVKHASKISPTDAQILTDEAKAMWNLRHFAIPAVHDLIRLDDGSMALVMSYIPGPTIVGVVQAYLNRGERVPPEHVAWITERCMNALAYMHRFGVVHGDLKPQNIIVQPDVHMVSLVDFGLAQVKPAPDDSSRGYTETFSPPEQMAGDPLTPQSDFYALGKTMIYTLGGGDLDRVRLDAIPHDVPRPMREFVFRLTDKDPTKRPDWRAENLMETVKTMRRESFGRYRSDMLPLNVG